MTAETPTEAVPVPKKIAQMTDHERLVALRLLDRRLGKVKKIWNGKVSAQRTSTDHLIEAAVPKSNTECRSRLEAIKTGLDELEDMKSARKAAIDEIKGAWDEILYSAPATAEQLELGATRAPITKAAVQQLKAAYNDAVSEDEENKDKGEKPKIPAESQADMDDLRARLDEMLASSGLGDVGFAEEITGDQTDPDAEVDGGGEDEEETAANTDAKPASKRRGKLTAV